MKNIRVKRILSLILIILVVLSTFGINLIKSYAENPFPKEIKYEDLPGDVVTILSTAEYDTGLTHDLYGDDLKTRYAIFCCERGKSWSSEDITGFTTKYASFTVSDFKLTDQNTYSFESPNEFDGSNPGPYSYEVDNSAEGAEAIPSEKHKTTATWYEYSGKFGESDGDIKKATAKEAYILAEMGNNDLDHRSDDPVGDFWYLSSPITEEEFIQRNDGVYKEVEQSAISWAGVLNLENAKIYESIELDESGKQTKQYYVYIDSSVTIDLTIKIEDVIEYLKKLDDSITEDATFDISGVIDSLTNLFGEESTFTTDFADSITTILSSDIAEDVKEFILDIIPDVYENVTEGTEIWESMKNLLTDSAETFNSLATTAWGSIKNFFGIGTNPQSIGFPKEALDIINVAGKNIGAGTGEYTGAKNYYKVEFIKADKDGDGIPDHEIEIDNAWGSYVQKAWWTTDENVGRDEVYEGYRLVEEAEAFEEYIMELKGVTNINDIPMSEYTDEYHIDGEYTVEGEEQTQTVQYTVYGPELNYNPKWVEVTDAKTGNEIKPEPLYESKDYDKNGVEEDYYRVGPFKIDYFLKGLINEKDGKIQVLFSGITGGTVVTNLGKITTVETAKDKELTENTFRICTASGEPVQVYSNYSFPNPDTEFFIEVKYRDGLESIENIEFDFKYMNAGAYYMNMLGWKYTYEWNFSSVPAGVKTDRTINVSRTRESVQKFSYGLSGARWYNETSLVLTPDLKVTDTYYKYKDYSGGLTITKEVLGKVDDGDYELTKVEKDTVYEFEVKIKRPEIDTAHTLVSKADGKALVADQNAGYFNNILVKDGDSETRKNIKVDEKTGEITDESGTKIDGSLLLETEVKEIKRYKVDSNGQIVRKEVTQILPLTVKKGQSKGILTLESEEWYGTERFTINDDGTGTSVGDFYGKTDTDKDLAPIYEVKEITKDAEGKVTVPDIDENGKYKYEKSSIACDNDQNSKVENGVLTGSYIDENIINIIAKNNYQSKTVTKSGKLVLKKLLVDENNNAVAAEQDTTFKFDVTIDGTTKNQDITVSKGSTMAEIELGVATWTGDNAPKYEVKETNSGSNYTFKEIKNASGSFIDGATVEVTAINTLIAERKAQIQIVKKLVNEKNEPIKLDTDTLYTFKVKVDGKFDEKVEVNIPKGKSSGVSEIIDVKWKSTETTPTYTVEEIDPNNELIEIYATSGKTEGKIVTGKLSDSEIVTVTATNKKQGEKEYTGSLTLVKQLVDKEENGELVAAKEDITFKFKVKVGEGTSEEKTITIKKGEKFGTINIGTFTWKENEKAPEYRIEEIDVPSGYDFIKIGPTQDKENKKVAIGKIENGKSVEVVAVNKVKDETKTGTLKIEKKLIDKDGNTYVAKENETFTFEVTVDGKEKEVELTVLKGSSMGSTDVGTYPWEGNNAPSYTVVETKRTGEYEDPPTYEEGQSGKLKAGETVIVKVINKKKDISITEKEYTGRIEIIKKLTDKDGKEAKAEKPVSFYFELKVGDSRKEIVEITIPAGESQASYTSDAYTWLESEIPPTYEVEEIGMSDSTYKKLEIVNAKGSLKKDETVVVEAYNSKGVNGHKGMLQINKTLLYGNTQIEGKEFTFNVTVNGITETITVESGNAWSKEYYWTGDTEPTYSVSEVGATPLSITNSSGKLKDQNTVIVDVVNRKEELENKVNLDINKTIKLNGDKVTGVQNSIFEFKVTIYYEDQNKYFIYNNEAYNYLEFNKRISLEGTDGETKGLEELINITYEGSSGPKYAVQEIGHGAEWELIETTDTNGVLSTDVVAKFTNKQRGPIYEVKYLMDLGGYVWNDTDYSNGKPADSGENGIRESSEEPISKAIVNIYKAVNDEKVNTEEIYTDENGHWEISDLPMAEVKEYYVTFTYDGQTFEPTIVLEKLDENGNPIGVQDDLELNKEDDRVKDFMYAKTDKNDIDDTQNRMAYINSSMAKEIEEDRKAFNRNFEKIEGEVAIDENGKTLGKTNKGLELEYTSKDVEFNTGFTKKASELITLNEDGTPRYQMTASTKNVGTDGLYYAFDKKAVLQSSDRQLVDGLTKITYIYKASYPYLNNINLGLVERSHADIAVQKELEEATVVVNGKVYKYKYGEIANTQFTNNLDLLYRQIEINQRNIKYDLNLYKSDYYYRASVYNNGTIADSATGETLYDKLISTYGSEEKLELDVYIKYKIEVTNESDTYDVVINKLSDYVDSSLQLVTVNETRYIEDKNGNKTTATVAEVPSHTWSNTNVNILDENSGIEYTKYEMTTPINLSTTKRSETLTLTFKVGKEEKDGITNCVKLGEKTNLVEIDSYSTYYADTETNRNKDRVNDCAGRVDEDSAPGNINIEKRNSINWYEDDTDASPMIRLGLYQEIRDLNGLVWEDEENNTIQYSQVIGNGKYDEENEKTIPNMTTELVEKITIGGKDYDFIWPTDTVLGTKTIKELTGFDSQIRTDSQGQYEFTGIPAGNYVVRFTYGDKNTLVPESPDEKGNIKYSGQDYKSTTYQTTSGGWDASKNISGDYIANEWHDLESSALATERISDARDDEARRLEVIAKSQDITYENSSIMGEDILQYGMDFEGKHVDFDDDASIYDSELKSYYMTANTAKINMNIESKLDSSGGIKSESLDGVEINVIDTNMKDTDNCGIRVSTIRYTVNNIDFGVETRSESNIQLDKQIEEITLRTSSGDVVLNAKYKIEYEYKNEDGTRRYIPKVELDTSAPNIGIENLQALNRAQDNSYLGFRYLNVDKDILQGATIEIKYRITALNIGEVDRCATLLKGIADFDAVINDLGDKYHNRDYTFGTYLGQIYYQGATIKNSSKDDIVTSKVKQVIDYVDNDVVFSQLDNTSENGSWANITTNELKDRRILDTDLEVLDKDGNNIRCITEEGVEGGTKTLRILDSNGVAYESETKNNIAVSIENATGTELANPEIMTPIQPVDATGSINNSKKSISLTVSRYYSSDLDIEEVENITEILKWYNDVGRRTPNTIQGNVKPALGALVALQDEGDASATEVITLSPPTGAITTVMYAIQVMAVILSALTILAGGIVLIKKKVLTK